MQLSERSQIQHNPLDTLSLSMVDSSLLEESSVLPSWEKTASQLSGSQRIAAEIDFSIKVLQTVRDTVAEHVPFYTSEASTTNKLHGYLEPQEVKVRHIIGMLDLYDAIQKDPKEVERFVSQWGEEGEFLRSRLNGRLPQLEDERDRVFVEAKNWGPKEGKKVTEKASHYARKLPKELRNLLHERSGITPQNLAKYVAESGITLGVNIASSWSTEAICFSAGVAGAAINPLGNVDTSVALGVVAAANALWIKEAAGFAKETWKLLEETGVSTSYTAKVLHDIAKRSTDNVAIQKGATYFGFAVWQVVWETPYILGALASPHAASLLGDNETKNIGLSFLAASATAAGGVNFAQKIGTRGILRLHDRKVGIGDTLKQVKQKFHNSTGVEQHDIHQNRESNGFKAQQWGVEDAQLIFNDLESRNWAPWLSTPEHVLADYAQVFPEGQLIIKDNDGIPIATLTTNRINWDGDPESLTTWDDIAGGSVEIGNYRNTYTPDGNTLVLMSMNVHPDHQGNGYAKTLVEQIQATAKKLGVNHVISPFRPTNYGDYKRQYGDPGFDAYCGMTREDGFPVDGWLRNLARNGMQPLKIAEKSMKVIVPTSQFEEYKINYNPQSWKQIGDDMWECGEVGTWQVSNGNAVYTENNIWGEIPF